MKLAFYDSGLGGLSVLKVFLDKLKDSDFDIEYFYIADTLRAPYGARSEQDLKSYVYDFAHFAENKNADYFISACNTSSNLFSDLDFSDFKFKTLNLFDAMNFFFEKDNCDQYIYLATEANIKSKKYLRWNRNIKAIACPELVPLIEANNLDEATSLILNFYLKNIELKSNTKIILGCTHYALLEKELVNLLDVDIINPANALYEIFEKSLVTDRLMKNSYSTYFPVINVYSTSLNSSLTTAISELILSLEK